MDQPTFGAGGGVGVGVGWGGVGATVVLEGEGKVGFDVSPGWRRALITERGTGERMCARVEGGQRSAAATLPTSLKKQQRML